MATIYSLFITLVTITLVALLISLVTAVLHMPYIVSMSLYTALGSVMGILSLLTWRIVYIKFFE